jgi:hypothetical protein
MYDADGIERDPNLGIKFWDMMLNLEDEDPHWVFMMSVLTERMENDKASIKEVFDWDSPEYNDQLIDKMHDEFEENDWDFPDPPDICR